MLIFLEFIRIFGLALLIGGAVFLRFIWRVFCTGNDPITAVIQQRVLLPVYIGAAGFILATGIRVIQFSSQLTDIISILLAVALLASFVNKSFRQTPYIDPLLAILALLLLFAVSLTTHAAAEPGLLPLSSNFIHLVVTVMWGGGLLYFLLLPWQHLAKNLERNGLHFWRVVDRFTNLTIIMLGAALLTGALLTFVHVHSDAAMDSTQYGQFLKLKMLLVVVLLVIVIVNILKYIPELKQTLLKTDAERFNKSIAIFNNIIRFKAFIIVSLLMISSATITYDPPDTAPFLNPQSWNISVDELPLRIEMRPVAGSTNNVRFEIFLPENSNIASSSQAEFDLYMPATGIGSFKNNAFQASADSYLGEGVFAMPGDWRFEVNIIRPGNIISAGVHDFEIPRQPLQEDLKTHLSFLAIGFTTTNTINFIVGLLLIFTFCWFVWQSRIGAAPPWVTVGASAGIAAGFYMIFSFMLVKTYPSTFWRNPEPYSANNILQGQQHFIQQCAECHGKEGKGDGPWALEHARQVLDLASPHLDVHTDGEIFWWITYGIPSLDMPASENELSEAQRWQVINFIRSIRHGIPGG